MKNEDRKLDGMRTVTEIQREIEYLWQDICLITQYQLKARVSVSPTQIPHIIITSPSFPNFNNSI